MSLQVVLPSKCYSTVIRTNDVFLERQLEDGSASEKTLLELYLAWEAYDEAGSEMVFVSANSAYWPIVRPNYLSNRLIGIVCLSLK